MTTLLPADTTGALPVWAVGPDALETLPIGVARWAKASACKAGAGEVLLVPGADGALVGAVLGLGGKVGDPHRQSLLAGALSGLPDGDWRLAEGHGLDETLASLGFLLGGYRFDRYRSKPGIGVPPRLVAGAAVDRQEAEALCAGVFLARDLINTPTNDLLPDTMETAVRALGAEFGAEVSSVVGDDLISQNFPMIHAVGRASSVAPRPPACC
jgi:leucyl aminopeptidase